MTRHLCLLGLIAALTAGPATAAGDIGEVFGETTFGFRSVGAVLGFLSPESDIGSTAIFGAYSDLGAFISSVPNLNGRPSLLYWSSDGYSEFQINIDAEYIFPLQNLYLYAGGGIGILFASFDTGSGTSVSETDPGVALFGGAGKKLSSKLRGQAELRLKFDGADTFGINAMLGYVFGP